MKYFAHSPRDGIEAQTYTDHIHGVTSLVKHFAMETGQYSKHGRTVLQQLAEAAAEYHDLGKLNSENQKVLSGETAAKVLPVNHVDAGAAHWLNDQRFSSFCAAITQAHHIGFPDFSAELNKGELIFRDTQISAMVDQELTELEAIHNNLIIRSKLSAYERSRITYQCNLSPQSTEELAKWIPSFPGPRLVILNTVQSAAVLADFFAQKYGRGKVEHLSTSLTPLDRESTLDRVKSRLDDSSDLDWTLVATSCVEAGVDLSFKTGFRELCSLSSLLQAAGRVNREGGNNKAEMWTFCIAEDGMLKLNPALKHASIVLKDYLEQNIPISPEQTTQSIKDEIALYGLNSVHRKLMEYEELQNFPQVECDFKVINSDTRLAVVDADVAKRLRTGKANWRELQKVSVQIAKHKLDELKIPHIIDEIYHWNLEYDNFIGYMAGIVKLKKFDGQVLII